MNGTTLPRIKKAWSALRGSGNCCRQSIDATDASWSDSSGQPPPGPYHGLLLGAILAVIAVAALAGGAAIAHRTSPLTGPYGPYVCLPANFIVRSADLLPQTQDFSLASNSYPGRENGEDTAWYNALPLFGASGNGFFSAEARHDMGDSAVASSPARDPRRRGIVNFSRGRVSIETSDGSIFIARLRQAAALPPAASIDPLEMDFFAPTADVRGRIPALFYGETLDSGGNPSRWAWRNGDYPQKTIRTCDFTEDMRMIVMRRLLLGLTVPVPGAYSGPQAGKYRDFVSLYAEQYDLAAALMLAIMHTESNFNPFAVSPSQAVGLMQIVPDTAGNEVYRYLMGTHGTPSMETLFTPESNIKYGAIYLHLLGRRYFGNVTNTASRQLCIIAAYNGGPNAVLRLFDTEQDAAVDRINSLTPEQVYSALTTEMPNLETRRYVEVVMDRLRSYSAN